MTANPGSSWHRNQDSSVALAQRLDRLARRLLPGGITALVIVLLAAPTGFPAATALLPGLVMASVFFWSVWRPASMSALIVFGLGLLMDLVGFASPGVDAFVFLLLHGIAVHARFGLMRLNFLGMWCIFAVLGSAACWLLWFLISLLAFRPMPLAPVIFECLLAIGVYPLLAAAGTWAHHRLANPEPQS
ncbi:rod shape-determining protein MreD [Acetobacter estunensis]|uniref:rod shape-determining protein MreD n=1 Tax=Acetobacter estunensis TaxID=104097 RepID=UPI001C2D8649|nr:rod shape-determining protein MreD [Acetobacter estunensis]MBV1836182.1 rod shape-determining protein MreD [Acetobacter estunensis]